MMQATLHSASMLLGPDICTRILVVGYEGVVPQQLLPDLVVEELACAALL